MLERLVANQILIMKKYSNKKRASFLDSIPKTSIENEDDELTIKCKFNFSYFDSDQDAGDDFSDWSHAELNKLLNKLKEYSKKSLEYWQKQPIGSGKHRSNIFEIYDGFPVNSDFVHPKYIPHQACWSRFRLESSVRFVGFVIPDAYHDKFHEHTGVRFDKNTFYIVFLDKNHRFYKTRS